MLLYPYAPLGLLLSVVTKQSIESPNQAKSFLPYFRPDCVENARNGATIAVLFALSEQKYDKKSITDLNFQRLPKIRFCTAPKRAKSDSLRESRLSLSNAPTHYSCATLS